MNDKYKSLMIAFISGGVLSAIITFVFTAYTKSNEAEIKEQIVAAKELVMKEIYKSREEENRRITSLIEDITTAKGKALNAVTDAEKAVSSIESVKSKVTSIAVQVKETSSNIQALQVKMSKAAKIDLNELGKIVEPAVLQSLSLTNSIVAFNLDSCPAGWVEYAPAQGRFLRGIDQTGSLDIKGRNPGHIQEDAFQGHRHSISAVLSTSHGPKDKAPHGFQSGGYSLPKTTTKDPITDRNYGDVRVAKETRPKNVAVLFCIKQ